MMSNFKILEEYPYYQIYEDGTIVNTRWSEPRQCKPSVKGTGYYLVRLKNMNGEWKCELLHRLVARAFIPNPDNLPEVNHIDLNKLNPHVDNLEWIDKSGNLKHYHRLKRNRILGE